MIHEFPLLHSSLGVQHLKRVFLSIFVISVVVVLGAWHISKSRTFQVFGEIVSKVETNEKVIALTVDDGRWGEEYANQVLNTLAELNVKGTFFLNGSGIQKNKQSAIALVNAGHQIGNHSYSHKRMVLMGLDEVQEEIIGRYRSGAVTVDDLLTN